jgi:hypothetical protein
MEKILENRKGNLVKETEDPYYFKDTNLYELYKKCLPPKEAYYYFPKDLELVEFNKKKPKKTYRTIYHNVPFAEHEIQYINEFKQFLTTKPEIKLPDYMDDALLLRYIYADECDYKEVYKRLVKYLEWANKTFPLIIQPKSKIIEILNKGFVYVYGRDCRYRPILVFRVREFVKNEKIYSVQEVIESGCFLGQFVINNMLIPGKVERWNLIINLVGAKILSLPDHIKKLIPIMNEAFVSRLHKNYIIGMTFILRILYKLVCAFLHESTIRKIKILSGKKDKSLFEEIRKDNIEQDIGGTAPDAQIGVENGLFPPRMPSEYFLLENERPEDLLISEEEYIQKYKSGEINKDYASPYIIEQLKIKDKNINDIENEEKNSKSIIQKSKTVSIQSSKNFKLEKNDTLQSRQMNIQDQKDIKKQQLKKLKENNILKVKTFIYHGWDYKPEYNMNQEKYKINYYNNNTIINEISSLSNKRNNFFSKITSISKKGHINFSRTFFKNSHI